MWLALVMVLSASAQDDQDAEQLFRQMEAKLSKATALDLSFEVNVEEGELFGLKKRTRLKGTLAASSGNKVRLEWSGENDTGKPFKVLTISDGTRMRTTAAGEPNQPKDYDTPKNLTAEFLTLVARPGVLLPQGPLPDEQVDAKVRWSVSGFKLGKKENDAERELQRLDYQLSLKGQKEPFSVTVWIDLKSGLPVKRLITSGVGEAKIAVSESYGKLTLDEKVDPKRFDLPK